MTNQVFLIGRLNNIPQVTKIDGKDTAIITIAVPRAYKNAEGIYETDYIDIYLYNTIAKNVVDYCTKGDLVGIKGKLEINTTTMPDGTSTRRLIVIAEKVTFLSSKKSEE